MNPDIVPRDIALIEYLSGKKRQIGDADQRQENQKWRHAAKAQAAHALAPAAGARLARMLWMER